MIRKGKRRDIQRYKCQSCNHWFSSKRRPDKLHQVIFNEYFYHKQTLKQLSDKYKRSIPWIRKQIFEYEPPFHTYTPRAVTVVADATFFGRRRDKFGVLVFKDLFTNTYWIKTQTRTQRNV